MKKKVLILSHALELGGAERSLIGLLDALDPEMWDVDLFLLRHAGELLSSVPEHITLLPEVKAYTVLARPMKQTLKEGHLLLTGARALAKIFSNSYAKRHNHTESGVSLEYSHKFLCPFMPDIQPDKEYDLAISFLTPHYFVAKKVKAKKKIAWIHTDYTVVQTNTDSEIKMWNMYDHIISISDSVTDSFSKVFPSLNNKLIIVENILPSNFVHSCAEENLSEEEFKRGIALVSIGRFCYQKNFDNVPAICAELIKSGLDIYWYLIGFGPDEELIKSKIAEAGMQDRVIILGKKDNPYPYIKACDLYVQPSRYEGKAVTVREAQMLCKPVVITDYPTAPSQLEDGVDGVIVPMDNKGCAKEIEELLRDKKRMNLLSKNCIERDYSNSEEVQKLYNLY
ncbi:MAG: glycosyltransferase [Ruminococcus sp.]|nr:glycosyltransferase [Ruminococcus sp.]